MADIKGYNMPDELYYHEEHSWARIEENRVVVGMNDMFQKEAGDIVFVDLPDEGDDVEQGEVCGKLPYQGRLSSSMKSWRTIPVSSIRTLMERGGS